MMTGRERDELLRLVANPPPGSKLAAAKEFGIDLTLLVRRLSLTPTARLQELATAQDAIRKLRQSLRRPHE